MLFRTRSESTHTPVSCFKGPNSEHSAAQRQVAYGDKKVRPIKEATLESSGMEKPSPPRAHPHGPLPPFLLGPRSRQEEGPRSNTCMSLPGSDFFSLWPHAEPPVLGSMVSFPLGGAGRRLC